MSARQPDLPHTPRDLYKGNSSKVHTVDMPFHSTLYDRGIGQAKRNLSISIKAI